MVSCSCTSSWIRPLSAAASERHCSQKALSVESMCCLAAASLSAGTGGAGVASMLYCDCWSYDGSLNGGSCESSDEMNEKPDDGS